MSNQSYISNFKLIESDAKKVWSQLNIYKVAIDTAKEKEVVLDFFPYPSGVGLHIGHTLGYIATDIYSRFKRFQGKNVLHAMGYDAFGLPAEQFAIENKQHPDVITQKNIANIKAQLSNLGLDHDVDRTFNTTDVDYYKWTQYIFLKLYNSYFDEVEKQVKPIEELIELKKKEGKSLDEIYIEIQSERLAYLDEVEVNWCPKLGTVLSNEEVIGGLSERGSYPVIKKPLKQWMFRITKLSERLIENLQYLDWPISVKEMQRNWVGLSYGHEVVFVCDNGKVLKVYTTRLETLTGVSFCCISKKHPDISSFYDDELPNEDVFDGILTKIKAVHPISGELIPVFIADYVVAYGTYAVMGVPAHDERDYLFAQKHQLPIKGVLKPTERFLRENGGLDGYIKNAANYPVFVDKTCMLDERSIADEIFSLENKDFVSKKKYTKLRDWVFSRQRYWGEPFPIILDEFGNPYSLEYDALPVELPYMSEIKGESVGDDVYKPLDDCLDWKEVRFIKLDNYFVRIVNSDEEAQGKPIYRGFRETNTMPNWAGSCWYYLRYMDNLNNDEFIGLDAKNYWETPKKIGAVDLYLGGAEHAVLHLLYARFWHICLYDLGLVNSKEPFQRLFNQGMILGPSYVNESGAYFSYKDIEKIGDDWFSKSTKEKLTENIGKIGKRYKNGITPEEVCDEYGIDSLRLFMMYLGPLEQSKPWDYSAIKGMVRVLEKVSLLAFEADYQDSDEVKDQFNKMLDKITADFQELRFNTAIAAFIIFLNSLTIVSLDLYAKLLVILSPLAPHLSEFLYQKHVKNFESILLESWPSKFENFEYQAPFISLVININGKKRDVLQVDFSLTQSEIIDFVEKYCSENNLTFKKIIVPNRTSFWYVNIVC